MAPKKPLGLAARSWARYVWFDGATRGSLLSLWMTPPSEAEKGIAFSSPSLANTNRSARSNRRGGWSGSELENFQVLVQRGRRASRVHLGADVQDGLDALSKALERTPTANRS